MIKRKTKEDIEKIRECGIISAQLFKYLKDYIRPGISTQEIDVIADSFIRSKGAIPSFKGYGGFPASVCISTNDEIIHGIPCKRVLKEGDIVGIDVGVGKFGVLSDSARTYRVGKVSDEVDKLLINTETALYKAISIIKNGIKTNEIGGAVEDYIKKFGYGIVKEYCGHGVGYKVHEDPEVRNYRHKRGGVSLKTGTVIAIEPMINLGTSKIDHLYDGWTVVTHDGKWSAHFENTVAVTEDGYDILTIFPDELESIKNKFGI